MRQVYFGSIASYDDLNLFLPEGGVETGIPEPKRTIVSVPGADGQLDMSYGLGGDVKFENRAISLEFVIKDHTYSWDSIFSELVTLLHGKQMNVWIDPETDYYWDAFCSVDSVHSDQNKGTFRIELDCDPYQHKDITLTATATAEGALLTANVTRQVVVPTVTSENIIQIEYEEETYSFDAGTHKDYMLRLPPGANTLLVKGSGAVAITYRDGRL